MFKHINLHFQLFPFVFLKRETAVTKFCSTFKNKKQVLKVAILSEKYACDYTWYVDTILQLIRVAGDYVSEEVWHRVIQIVINRDDAQGYAAKTVFEVGSFFSIYDNV